MSFPCGRRSSSSHLEASSVVTLRLLHLPSLLGAGSTAPFPKLAKSSDTASATFFQVMAHGGVQSPQMGAISGMGKPCFAT